MVAMVGSFGVGDVLTPLRRPALPPIDILTQQTFSAWSVDLDP
jgi:hypothetical protein